MAGPQENRPFASSYTTISTPDPADVMARHMRAVEGPLGPSNAVRQAIVAVWRALPEAERTPGRVEAEVRRLVDRALRDFGEDSSAFGFEAGAAPPGKR